MNVRHSYRTLLCRIVPGIFLLFILSGCHMLQAWRIERINKIPEKNAEMEQKLIEQEAEAWQKQAEKEYKLALKEHQLKQSESTRAHMKYMKKRSVYANRFKKRPLCDRLFNPGCK